MQKEFTHDGKKYIAKSGRLEKHAIINICDENNICVGVPLVGGDWTALAFATLGYSQTRLLQTGGASEEVMIDRLIDAWIFDFKWRQIGKEHRRAQGLSDPDSDPGNEASAC